MTDRSIESELKDVHKKLDDIEKKAAMGERPSTHLPGEMM
jgi:tetrahydromethanopterin S-methyltransferase subunit G